MLSNKTGRLGLCSLTGFILVAIFFTPVQDTSAETSFREYRKDRVTYPFGDPDPVPALTRFYPYFRFDGFAKKSVTKSWNVVQLENEYLSLEIYPEIGGKIWSITEKSTGKSIIYSNPVVKFRDVAMRGPWTSGGIEMNFGIIGHTPNCSSPVDYFVRKNSDQSVSCFIGTLDLVTRSTWTVEINLPDHSSVFSTRICRHNGSGQMQPYYTWTNVGIRAGNDLQCVYPGTHYVGHGGDAHPWPLDPASGKDLSWYKNNDFGSYKSYHVVGRAAEFFGGYYHDEDFGVVSVFPMAGKRGRKLWIWGLSREGMIWENLLTDPPGGQYVEIQSGRLFNQCRGASSLTMFKSRDFAPYSSDVWEEYWMPVLGTGGYNAASPYGAMNVSANNGEVKIGICPSRQIKAPLKIYDGDKLLWQSKEPLVLTPAKPYNSTHSFGKKLNDLRVVLGDKLLFYPADDREILGISWDDLVHKRAGETASADYLDGREHARQREYVEADAAFKKCVEKDPLYLPAYVGRAEIANGRGDYPGASDHARDALDIDINDGAANYQYGIAALHMNWLADAKAAFAMATVSEEYRSAAFTMLGKTYLREGRWSRALDAAESALSYNTTSPDAHTVRLCALRKMKDSRFNSEVQKQMESNPICVQYLAERYLSDRTQGKNLLNRVRCELPHETFLELVIWYANAGLTDDAISVLEIALEKKGIIDAELRYWLAYLKKDKSLLAAAEKAPSDFCLPFRPESRLVFRWAKENGSSWKNIWYLAVLDAFLERTDEAKTLLNSCDNDPDWAPFYAFRAAFVAADAEKDLKYAMTLEPDSPRWAGLYGQWLADHQRGKDLFAITGKYSPRFPDDMRLVVLHAQALLMTKQYDKAFDYLKETTFLPNEGKVLGRTLYWEATMTLAALRYRDGKYEEAARFVEAAREWPENLGAGKPYPDYCDERLEDWLSVLISRKIGKGNPAKEKEILQRMITPLDAAQKKVYAANSFDRLFTALAYRALGDEKKATQLLSGSDLRMKNYYDGKPFSDTDNKNVTERVLDMIR